MGNNAVLVVVYVATTEHYCPMGLCPNPGGNPKGIIPGIPIGSMPGIPMGGGGRPGIPMGGAGIPIGKGARICIGVGPVNMGAGRAAAARSELGLLAASKRSAALP